MLPPLFITEAPIIVGNAELESAGWTNFEGTATRRRARIFFEPLVSTDRTNVVHWPPPAGVHGSAPGCRDQ
jgi:hypothetical protein